MGPRQYKDEVFGHFARIGAAMGQPKRVEIIDVLAQGERSVESLARQIAATVPNTSRHLQILAAAGLVTRRVEGSTRVYRLTDESVEAGYLALISLAERHIESISTLSQAFFGAADGVRPLTIAELDELCATSANVLLVDVRPPREFRAGHVEGAVNIPFTAIAERFSEIPADSQVVAYCRGPYCVMSASAVTQLRRLGVAAVRLDGGFPQWKQLGRKISVDD